MVVGSVTTVIWHNVPVLKDFVYELVPAFIFALLAVVIGSLLTKPPAEVDI
jgi:Na+/proline symporter